MQGVKPVRTCPCGGSAAKCLILGRCVLGQRREAWRFARNGNSKTGWQPAMAATAATKSCKVILLGNGSVGKTSICARFLENGFSPEYKQTVGLDTLSKQVTVRGRRGGHCHSASPHAPQPADSRISLHRSEARTCSCRCGTSGARP